MNRKVRMIVLLTVLVGVGIAVSQLRASARCEPNLAEVRGEASYTTYSAGVPWDNHFDFAMRDEGGEDLGWSMVRTGPTPGVGYDPGFAASARIHSVEFHDDIAVFVAVWERGITGDLGPFFGLGSSAAGVGVIVGMRDGAAGGFADQVSEAFFWAPEQVPADPNALLGVEALDDFGDPFPGFEGWTVRDFIVQQLQNLGGNPIHPGGNIHICSGL